MGTLLNRRRYMGGGSSLPYDAELEYLESTGTQYIDTGINLRNKLVATMKFIVPSLYSKDEALFGAWYDNVSTPRFMLYIRSTNKWGIVGTGISVSGVGGNNANVTTNSNYTATINATQAQTSDVTLYVFARNNDKDNFVPSYIKLFSLEINVGDVLVREYIPVRKNGIGFLYDKVSGELFGNIGTGSFTLGPDKT